MPGAIRICAPHWFGRQDFSCSPAPIGRCCRWSPVPRSPADRRFMASRSASTAPFLPAAGAIAASPLRCGWKLQPAMGTDLTPSMHWPAPITVQDIEQDRGPVLVTVEYRIRPQDHEAFLDAIAKLEPERRRDG